jgi:hypothetical protein
MPCDTIQINNIEIGKMHAGLLGRALAALNATGIAVTKDGAVFTLDGVRCQIRGGRLQVPAGAEHLADTLKTAYSRQVVFQAAKVNGWSLKETRANVFQVIK